MTMLKINAKGLRRNKHTAKRRGQGMTEYIIIVGLIAILLIAAVKAFRNTLARTYNTANDRVKTQVTDQINTDDSSNIR